jgi:hypothetical protein
MKTVSATTINNMILCHSRVFQIFLKDPGHRDKIKIIRLKNKDK